MKWYGAIGFAEMTETSPGIYEEVITEHTYYGDVIRSSRLLQNSGEINDNVNISNQISIIADAYAVNHIHTMRYIVFQNSKWKITNVEIQHPRLLMTVGGLYNVNSIRATDEA